MYTFSKLYTYVAGPLGSNSKEQVIRLKLSEFIGNTNHATSSEDAICEIVYYVCGWPRNRLIMYKRWQLHLSTLTQLIFFCLLSPKS